MRYVLLVYTDERAREAAPQEAVDMMYQAYGAFSRDLGDRLVGGEELEPSSTATTVRIEGGPGGDPITTDGPFAETKEQLGGFFVVEAGDLDEAIEIAARVPSAAFGSIEVRPVAAGPPPGVGA